MSGKRPLLLLLALSLSWTIRKDALSCFDTMEKGNWCGRVALCDRVRGRIILP